MKNLVLSLLAFGLLFVASVTESYGQILTQQSITQAQWYALEEGTANPLNLSGIWAFASAGSLNPEISEFGISSFQGENYLGYVPGGWNFNTPYQFSFTNDLGGAYQLTFTQGSNTYQTPILRPTTPYVDLVFAVEANHYPWKPAIEITNLTLTLGGAAYSLPDLSAGITEPQNFQGFILYGTGDNWTSIAGQ